MELLRMKFKRSSKELSWYGPKGKGNICRFGMYRYFEIPDDCMKITVSLHTTPAKNRVRGVLKIRRSGVESDRYPYIQMPGQKGLRGSQVDSPVWDPILKKLLGRRKRRVLYVQVELS